MKYILAALCFLCAALAASQTAKVISLSDKDADTARQAYENLQKAQKTWDDVQDSIKKTYLQVGYGDPEAGSQILTGADVLTGGITWISGYGHELTKDEKNERAKQQAQTDKEYEARRKKARYERKGWSYGFEFTSDFRYIVPKAEPVYKPNPWGQQIFLTPSTGNPFIN